MRVLSINALNCQTKVNNTKPCGVAKINQQPVQDTFTPSFKGSGAGAAAIFATILGGAAAVLAAPIAVIAGAAAIGAFGGVASSYNGESDDLERYKFSHEY